MTSPISGVTSSLTSANAVQTSSTQSGSSWQTIRNDVLNAVSSQLGVSPSDLQSELSSGQSLSDIAQTAGVSSDQLTDTITTALSKENLPANANLGAIAQRMATHVGHHHHAHAASQSSTTAASSSTTLDGVPQASSSDDDSSSAVNTYL